MPKHTATIVITDNGDDTVTVKTTFEVADDPNAGARDDSAAHRTAVSMLAFAVRRRDDTENEDD